MKIEKEMDEPRQIMENPEREGERERPENRERTKRRGRRVAMADLRRKIRLLLLSCYPFYITHLFPPTFLSPLSVLCYSKWSRIGAEEKGLLPDFYRVQVCNSQPFFIVEKCKFK